jgi:hypothetical protein
MRPESLGNIRGAMKTWRLGRWGWGTGRDGGERQWGDVKRAQLGRLALGMQGGQGVMWEVWIPARELAPCGRRRFGEGCGKRSPGGVEEESVSNRCLGHEQPVALVARGYNWRATSSFLTDLARELGVTAGARQIMTKGVGQAERRGGTNVRGG